MTLVERIGEVLCKARTLLLVFLPNLPDFDINVYSSFNLAS